MTIPNQKQLKLEVPLKKPYNWDYDFSKTYEEEPVTIEAEPENPIDTNALMIKDQFGKLMGYVPKEIAQLMTTGINKGILELKNAKVKEIINSSYKASNQKLILVEITVNAILK